MTDYVTESSINILVFYNICAEEEQVIFLQVDN